MSPNPDPNQTPTPVLRSSVGLNVKRTSTRSSSRIAYSAAGQRRSSTNQNRVRKTYTETDKMQAGMRPRQRTFTSCTECRRRKQRCNQAKDRPCNNCARRYPPVACTYESSSPPPSIDRIVDFHDDRGQGRASVPSTSPGPSYVQTSSPESMSYAATPATTDGYYNSSYGYYSAPAAPRNDYPSYSAGGSSPGYAVPAYTTSAGYTPVSAGYYQSATTSYTPVTSGGYYSSSQQDSAWLSTADPAAFAGAGSADYYYVADPDPGHHHGHASSGP